MNKRRLIRKLLRPGMILIYLLLITLTVVICTYAFGGIDAVLLQVKAGNLADSAVIIREDKDHPEYVAPKVDTKNWF